MRCEVHERFLKIMHRRLSSTTNILAREALFEAVAHSDIRSVHDDKRKVQLSTYARIN
jgi:hypothetical protein